MNVIRLMGSECPECQQCDSELNAASIREPMKTSCVEDKRGPMSVIDQTTAARYRPSTVKDLQNDNIKHLSNTRAYT